MTEPTTFADANVVTLRCSAPDCGRWQTAQGRHLANLLAGGPWRCPDHKRQPVLDTTLPEVPC